MKSSTWGSSESGWNKWILRDLFLSVALLHLLKRIKAGGFHEATCQKPLSPNATEAAWIEEKLKILDAAGIPFHAEGTMPSEDAKWLKDYIKAHSREEKLEWDIKAVERRVKAKLPKSYLDFVKAVGPKAFDTVDGYEGNTVSILMPDCLEVHTGIDDFEDEESRTVNALTFATMVDGDCFCFDVQKGKKEFAVVRYKHEVNFYEP